MSNRSMRPLNSIRYGNKSLDKDQQEALEKEEKAKKVKLSVKGFADAPAVFIDSGSKLRVLGGVVSRGEIIREVAVNLAALRALQGADEQETKNIRRYLLSLALIAACAELDLYLREGCHLRFADDRDIWQIVPRRGELTRLEMASDEARKLLLDYGKTAVKPFINGWPKQFSYKFGPLEKFKVSLQNKEAPLCPCA